MSDHDNVTPLPLSDQDIADLASLEENGIAAPALTEEVTYHPILMVWREILKPAAGEAGKKVTPQYASRIVASYQGVTFGDMNEMQARYYAKIIELSNMLDAEIASDDECLLYTSPEEDVEHNSQHYKNLLRDWQVRVMEWELAWDCADPYAGVELAAISEVHKAFFGPTGLTQFLDNIKLEYTEADQAEMAAILEGMKEGS